MTFPSEIQPDSLQPLLTAATSVGDLAGGIRFSDEFADSADSVRQSRKQTVAGGL